MAAAALARVLRGGRRYGACSHLPPLTTGIGRRAPLERAAAPLIQRPGAAGDAGGIGRRLLSSEAKVSAASRLERLREEYMWISGSHQFVPYDSELALLDLARRVDNIVYRTEMYNRYVRYVVALVSVLVVMTGGYTAYVCHQHKANQKCLDEIKASTRQTETCLEEIAEQMP